MQRYHSVVKSPGEDFLLHIETPFACQIRGNSFKLKRKRFRLHVREKFFIQRVMRHGQRLPREVVDTPYMEKFQARLDRVLSYLL